MKSTVAAIATLGMLAVPALAADLPSRKEVVAPVYVPIFTWTGFYIGLNAGVGWQDKSSVYVTTPSGAITSVSTGNSSAGFIGGGQIGYNYQMGSWVLGVEADIQYADVGGKVNWGPYSWWGNGGGNDQYFGTVRARIGYAIDHWLLYATGGFAYGGFNSNWAGGSSDTTGWTVGGGVEYAFTQNWTVKLEGLYLNMNNNNQTLAFFNPPGGVLPAGTYTAVGQSSKGAGVVRVGVNYKF